MAPDSLAGCCCHLLLDHCEVRFSVTVYASLKKIVNFPVGLCCSWSVRFMVRDKMMSPILAAHTGIIRCLFAIDIKMCTAVCLGEVPVIQNEQRTIATSSVKNNCQQLHLV